MKTSFKIVFTALLFSSSIGLFAQVGIGTNTPHPNAVLDLTNTNQKVLVLPKLSSHPTSDTLGMLYFSSSDSVAYFNDGTEFNGVTPWKYNYGLAGADYLYYNPTTFKGVGIGLNNPTIGNLVSLQIKGDGLEAAATGTSASLFIGDTDAQKHMLFDADEILVKSDPTTLDTLRLQEGSAGVVQVGDEVNRNAKLNVYGKLQENGKDLMPSGMIIMWSGALGDIPGGWALCDGNYYDPTDMSDGQVGQATSNATHTSRTPDLRERFVVGAGLTNNTAVSGTTQYTPGDTGGQNSSSHTHAVDPPNTQTTDDGQHTHTGETDDASGGDRIEKTHTCCDRDWVSKDDHEHDFTTDPDGEHHHDVNIASFTSGSATVNNRPPYMALAYIMKL